MLIFILLLPSLIFFFCNLRNHYATQREIIKICPVSEPHKRNSWLSVVTVFVIVVLLCSCGEMKTGFYTVKEIRGANTVVFKELPNDAYHVPRADTLKIGQKVHLKRVFREKDADVW